MRLPARSTPPRRLAQRLSGWVAFLVALVALSSSPALAQFPPIKVLDGIGTLDNPTELAGPLIEQDPFDLVYLDELNKFAILKILPPLKPVTKPFPADEVLRFDFAEDSEYTYQVPFSRVIDYKTYNELLLEESEAYLQQNNYTAALRNLLYVYDHGGRQNPAIVEVLNSTLFQDATKNFREGRFELSLSIYEDIYSKNPDFDVPGFDRSLGEILMACYEGIIRGHFERADYFKARNLLLQIGERYPEISGDLIASWEERFDAESDRLIAEAREVAARGDGREAHRLARRANTISPGREANRDLYDEINLQFPMIFVGVNETSDGTQPERMESWGARRVNRLTQRKLVEFAGTSDDGGRYSFIGGQIQRIDEIGLEYELELQEPTDTFGVPRVNAYEVASLLASHADPGSPNYLIPWAKVVKSVEIVSQDRVRFQLRFPFVRPEALLQLPLTGIGSPGDPVLNGPYVPAEREGDFSTFVANPAYEPLPDRQYPRIIEQKFRDSSDAIDALIKGDIDIVDRVPISDLGRLDAIPEIETRKYVIPTVHMLVPNLRNDFMRNSNFRMGLLRGINRELIVREMLCGGKEISGCEVISGPWPIGTEDNDQLAYGYNLQVRPLDYNLKLAMVLVELSGRMLEDQRREDGEENPKVERPPIVLAHPDNYVANLAAQAIAQNWGEMGVEVQLRRLPDGESVPPDEDWDFLYVAASMEEPLVDADKLFGVDGLVENVTAPLEQSLRRLSFADSWQAACATLRRMHRQSTNDLMIIPLWQLNEYVAYRNNVREIGRNLIHLYENVDRWNISSTYHGSEP